MFNQQRGQQEQLALTRGRKEAAIGADGPTWPQAEDEPAVGIRARQDREEALVQDVLHRGRLQVLEDLRPGLVSGVVVEQQLQSAVVIKLPGPQEAQQEGVIQSGPETGLLLKYHRAR